jgi:hypothetical protein
MRDVLCVTAKTGRPLWVKSGQLPRATVMSAILPKFLFSSDTNTDDGGSEDSRRSSDDGGHSGDDGSRSSHKDSDSTAPVDILQWAAHFGPWLAWLCPPTRPPPDQSVLILS